MADPSLITTFDTWLPHQQSNASDDLILALEAAQALPDNCRVLHRLPVDVDLAWDAIQIEIAHHRPAYVLACGMAESRSRLSFELQAISEPAIQACALSAAADAAAAPILLGPDAVRRSPVPPAYWQAMGTRWRCAEVSENAGHFVCNGLYYRLLDPAFRASLALPSRGGGQAAETPTEAPTEAQILFVHVPILTPDNREALMADFRLLLSRLMAWPGSSPPP
ncbi:MAG: hypothetical protein HC824_17855 [Synechococcales cyanobacterium RM1_1_8]|nr:hypothetical protein [Synechococcales cyanobacterium RM1_1_8]